MLIITLITYEWIVLILDYSSLITVCRYQHTVHTNPYSSYYIVIRLYILYKSIQTVGLIERLRIWYIVSHFPCVLCQSIFNHYYLCRMSCYTWSVCNFKQHKPGWLLDWSVGGKSSSPSTHEGLLRVVPATFPGRQEHLTVWDLSSMRFLLQHRWAAMTSHVPPSAETETDRQTDRQR